MGDYSPIDVRTGRQPAESRSATGYLPLRPDGRPMSRRSVSEPLVREYRSAFALAPRRTELLEPPSFAVRRFPREHRLFTAVLLVATVVRVIVMLGYPPAFWYPDSLPYVQAALSPAPYAVRPVGYSFFLVLLEPLHSVLILTALQHAMGLAVGLMIYVLLRGRFRLSAFTSTIAAVPALLSVYAMQLEHYVLSDTFFELLITVTVVIVLWRPTPRTWACGLAGLLLGWAALVRSQGLLLGIPLVVYLATPLIRRGTRLQILAGILAMVVALAAPLATYAWWFDQVNGSFQLTTSTGAFLYSRVAGFAEC